MENKRDYYEVLGVSRSADKSAIKSAYRKIAKKYHPDTNAGNEQAEEKFKEATEAYDVLSDPEKRKLYDRFGHAAFDGTAGGYGEHQNTGSYRYSNPGGAYREYHFEGGDMDDILKNIFGGGFDHGSFHSDGFNGGSWQSGFGDSGFGGSGFGSDSFGGGFRQGSFRKKGVDLHAEITVSFDEAAFGCEKVLHLSDENTATGGSSLKVKIPAGIDTGKSIRLRGKGQPGIGGREPGDLLLKVTVGTRPGFERKGQDVYTTARVPYTVAVFGGETVVQTLYGNVLCKIKPGTQSGTKIRLRGKGIVSMKNQNVRGDQYVTVQIDVPKNLSEDAKRKLREFEKACAVSKGAA